MQQVRWGRLPLITMAVLATSLVFVAPSGASSSKLPAAPRNVTAVGAHASATVKWLAPTTSGSSKITRYTATSSPGGRTCVTTRTTCVVTGLKNGTAYTFKVSATSKVGTGPSSKASNKVTPTAAVTSPTSVAFTGSYSGTLALLITNDDSTSASATVSSISGTGTGTDLGASKLSGSGQVPDTSTNTGFNFNGTGTLTGATSTLTLSVVSSSANAPDGAGTVTLSGTAKITGGTGTFAHASGTLKFSGAFTITGVDTGSQNPAFNSTISGTINL